jgi:predicted ATPase
MRLSKLKVSNFGSLQDVAVDFGPVTVLVGPNDAGKSMILRALEVLTGACTAVPGGWATIYQNAASFRDSTFNGRGGEQRFAFDGALAGIGCSYGVGVKMEANAQIASEFIDLKTYGRSQRIVREQTVERGESVSVTALGETREARLAGGSAIPLISQNNRLAYTQGPVEGEWRALLANLERLSSDLHPLRRFRLFPGQLRRPVSVDAELPAPPQITGEGRGLPGAMANLLLSDRDSADRIEEALKAALPGVRRLSVVTRDVRLSVPRDLPVPSELDDEQGMASVETARFYDLALETASGSKVSSRNISDGVLLYMAYLLLAMGPSSQGPLLIEEPETGIHPGLLEKLVQLLRHYSEGLITSSPVQVILTTHSPLLLNLVRPDEIRVISKREDGATQVTPFVDAPDLQRLLEFQGPGELWVNMGEDYIRRAKSAG